jgi:hypothetical protein
MESQSKQTLREVLHLQQDLSENASRAWCNLSLRVGDQEVTSLEAIRSVHCMPVADTWVSPSTVCFDFGQQIEDSTKLCPVEA